jgi:hypothetical protein
MHCHFCKKEIETVSPVGRQDRCQHCGMDLHICRNCSFYDEKAYNECHESQADRVVDKDKSNFCDYFSPSGMSLDGGKADPAAEARKKLEALFKK